MQRSLAGADGDDPDPHVGSTGQRGDVPDLDLRTEPLPLGPFGEDEREALASVAEDFLACAVLLALDVGLQTSPGSGAIGTPPCACRPSPWTARPRRALEAFVDLARPRSRRSPVAPLDGLRHPWENAVTACFAVLCGTGTEQDVRDLLKHCQVFDFTTDLVVFDTRLRRCVLDNEHAGRILVRLRVQVRRR